MISMLRVMYRVAKWNCSSCSHVFVEPCQIPAGAVDRSVRLRPSWWHLCNSAVAKTATYSQRHLGPDLDLPSLDLRAGAALITLCLEGQGCHDFHQVLVNQYAPCVFLEKSWKILESCLLGLKCLRDAFNYRWIESFRDTVESAKKCLLHLIASYCTLFRFAMCRGVKIKLTGTRVSQPIQRRVDELMWVFRIFHVSQSCLDVCVSVRLSIDKCLAFMFASVSWEHSLRRSPNETPSNCDWQAGDKRRPSVSSKALKTRFEPTLTIREVLQHVAAQRYHVCSSKLCGGVSPRAGRKLETIRRLLESQERKPGLLGLRQKSNFSAPALFPASIIFNIDPGKRKVTQ